MMIKPPSCISCGKLKQSREGQLCRACARRRYFKQQNLNWTPEEIATLKQVYALEKASAELKTELQKRHTRFACFNRARLLGIQPKRKPTLKIPVVELRA